MTRPTIRRMSDAVAGPAIVLGAVAAVAVIAVLAGLITGGATGGKAAGNRATGADTATAKRTAVTATTTVRTAAVSSTTGAETGAAFTACMRAHDLPGFPDVTFSSDGLVNLDIRGEKVDGSSRIYGAAVDACEPLLPAGSRLPGAPSAPSAPSAPDVTRS